MRFWDSVNIQIFDLNSGKEHAHHVVVTVLNREHPLSPIAFWNSDTLRFQIQYAFLPIHGNLDGIKKLGSNSLSSESGVGHKGIVWSILGFSELSWSYHTIAAPMASFFCQILEITYETSEKIVVSTVPPGKGITLPSRWHLGFKERYFHRQIDSPRKVAEWHI